MCFFFLFPLNRNHLARHTTAELPPPLLTLLPTIFAITNNNVHQLHTKQDTSVNVLSLHRRHRLA